MTPENQYKQVVLPLFKKTHQMDYKLWVSILQLDRIKFNHLYSKGGYMKVYLQRGAHLKYPLAQQ